MQTALARLGANPTQNELLAELIKLGAQQPGCNGKKAIFFLLLTFLLYIHHNSHIIWLLLFELFSKKKTLANDERAACESTIPSPISNEILITPCSESDVNSDEVFFNFFSSSR